MATCEGKSDPVDIETRGRPARLQDDREKWPEQEKLVEEDEQEWTVTAEANPFLDSVSLSDCSIF